MKLIYKIIPYFLWKEAEKIGQFNGAPVDIEDGFIHFSFAHQLAETANKHFKGQSNLLLVTVDEKLLEQALRYEKSRGGDFFPHLYTSLDCSNVYSVISFMPDENGIFYFQDD